MGEEDIKYCKGKHTEGVKTCNTLKHTVDPMLRKKKAQGGVPRPSSAPSTGPVRTLLPDIKAQGGNSPKFRYPSVLRCLPLSVRPARLHLQPGDE